MISASYRIAGGDYEQAGTATRELKEQLKRIGVEAGILRRIMITAYEAEMNVVIHAFQGNMWTHLDRSRLEIEVTDQGPGIPDIELALREGFSTAPDKARTLGFGAGMGLPNMKKNSDRFEIESRVGRGTRVRSTIFLKPQNAAGAEAERLRVKAGRCRACLKCLSLCPTRALRVWNATPRLLEGLCIGCTACISACPDNVFNLNFPEGEGGPEAGLEGCSLVLHQGFLCSPPAENPLQALPALLAAGVREVRPLEEWETGLREAVLAWSRTQELPRPVLSPLCPAIVNLVQTRFPSLIPNLAPFLSPLEAAAEDFALGKLLMVPSCPAQQSLIASREGAGRVVGLPPERLARVLRDKTRPPAAAGGAVSAAAGAPAAADGLLQAGGLVTAQKLLELAECGRLEEIEVLELTLCAEGCFGSPLNLGNPSLARHRWNRSGLAGKRKAEAFRRTRPFAPRTGLRLDEDMNRAIGKLSRIDELIRKLPGRDCGACGSPTCAALAEDIVLGRIAEAHCPYSIDGGTP